MLQATPDTGASGGDVEQTKYRALQPTDRIAPEACSHNWAGLRVRFSSIFPFTPVSNDALLFAFGINPSGGDVIPSALQSGEVVLIAAAVIGLPLEPCSERKRSSVNPLPDSGDRFVGGSEPDESVLRAL